MKKVWLLFSEHTLPIGTDGHIFQRAFSTLKKAEANRDARNIEEAFINKETGEAFEYFIIESVVH